MKDIVQFNEDLGEFVGMFIGDGFMGKYSRVRMIQFTGHPNDDREYLENKLVPLIKNIFSVEPHVRIGGRGLRVTCYSKRMYKILKSLKLPSGKKSAIIEIPEFFLKDEKIIKGVLRGIFDTDGTIVWDKRKIYKKPYPRLSIATISKKLAKQINSLLLDLGFRPCLRKVKRIKKVGSQIYYIELYGFTQLNKWLEEIGFSNNKHIVRLMPQ